MDTLADLSIESLETRTLLKSLGATHIIWDSIKTYSAFRYSHHDDAILASSRKALVCFEDSELMTLFQKWFALCDTTFGIELPGYDTALERKIATYF